jgi:hypothetical protein
MFERIVDDQDNNYFNMNCTVKEEVEELEESKNDMQRAHLDTSLMPLDISRLGKDIYDPIVYDEDEGDEEDQPDVEVVEKNDEFWTKHAERINSKMNGIMKSMT